MDSLIIRHAEKSDVEAIRDIHACPKVFTDTLLQPYPSLDYWQNRLSESRSGCYYLVAELEGSVVGLLKLEVLSNPRRKHVGTLSISVLEHCHRQGIGSRLLAAAVDMADKWLNLTRLEMTVYTDNIAAITLYKKVGFVIEGESAQYAFRDGEYVSVYHMGRLCPSA